MNAHAGTLAADDRDAPHCYRHPGRETLVSCSECGRPICEDCMTFAPVGIRCPDHANVGAPRTSRAAHRCARRAAHTVGSRRRRRSCWSRSTSLVYLVTVYQGGGISQPGGALFNDWRTQRRGGRRTATGGGSSRRCSSTASMLHLVFNMLALYWLGTVVEQALGTAAVPARLLRLRGSPGRPERSVLSIPSQSRSVPRARSSASSARSSCSSTSRPGRSRARRSG